MQLSSFGIIFNIVGFLMITDPGIVNHILHQLILICDKFGHMQVRHFLVAIAYGQL
jgi:hypothetical protein